MLIDAKLKEEEKNRRYQPFQLRIVTGNSIYDQFFLISFRPIFLQLFNVTVLIPPKFTAETPSYTNLMGGNVKFMCNVTGNPPPVIEW